MAQNFCRVVNEYEKRLQGMPYVPNLSYGRAMVGEDDAPNKIFLKYLFCEHAIAIEFMKDVGLLRGKMQCNTCRRDMTWSVHRFSKHNVADWGMFCREIMLAWRRD